MQNSFSPNLAALAATLGRDLSLAGRILQRANLETPALKRCVDSVEQGVMLLGLQRVRHTLLDLPLNLSPQDEKPVLREVNDRGVRVGRIAAWLADELPRRAIHFQNGVLRPVSPDTACTLGLLHDCGLLVLAHRLPDYADFYREEMAVHGYLRVTEERRLLGTDHGLAGALVAMRWCLPEPFCQAICDHNQEGGILQPGRKVALRQAAALCGILNLAEWILAHVAQSPLPPLPDGLFDFFGMTADDMENMAQSRKESV
ncbi:MAG: HDOD domain-containing protein [Magnetococcales bacterium]|nr:HDOD domain-containing protein [Magnetococcales bacterium]